MGGFRFIFQRITGSTLQAEESISAQLFWRPKTNPNNTEQAVLVCLRQLPARRTPSSRGNRTSSLERRNSEPELVRLAAKKDTLLSQVKLFLKIKERKKL